MNSKNNGKKKATLFDFYNALETQLGVDGKLKMYQKPLYPKEELKEDNKAVGDCIEILRHRRRDRRETDHFQYSIPISNSKKVKTSSSSHPTHIIKTRHSPYDNIKMKSEPISDTMSNHSGESSNTHLYSDDEEQELDSQNLSDTEKLNHNHNHVNSHMEYEASDDEQETLDNGNTTTTTTTSSSNNKVDWKKKERKCLHRGCNEYILNANAIRHERNLKIHHAYDPLCKGCSNNSKFFKNKYSKLVGGSENSYSSNNDSFSDYGGTGIVGGIDDRDDEVMQNGNGDSHFRECVSPPNQTNSSKHQQQQQTEQSPISSTMSYERGIEEEGSSVYNTTKDQNIYIMDTQMFFYENLHKSFQTGGYYKDIGTIHYNEFSRETFYQRYSVGSLPVVILDLPQSWKRFQEGWDIHELESLFSKNLAVWYNNIDDSESFGLFGDYYKFLTENNLAISQYSIKVNWDISIEFEKPSFYFTENYLDYLDLVKEIPLQSHKSPKVKKSYKKSTTKSDEHIEIKADKEIEKEVDLENEKEKDHSKPIFNEFVNYLYIGNVGNVITLHKSHYDLSITCLSGIFRTVLFPPSTNFKFKGLVPPVNGIDNKDNIKDSNNHIQNNNSNEFNNLSVNKDNINDNDNNNTINSNTTTNNTYNNNTDTVSQSYFYFDEPFTPEDLSSIKDYNGRIVYLKQNETIFVPSGWYCQVTILSNNTLLKYNRYLSYFNLSLYLEKNIMVNSIDNIYYRFFFRILLEFNNKCNRFIDQKDQLKSSLIPFLLNTAHNNTDNANIRIIKKLVDEAYSLLATYHHFKDRLFFKSKPSSEFIDVYEKLKENLQDLLVYTSSI